MKKTSASLLALCLMTGLSGCQFMAPAQPAPKNAVCYVLANTACSQGLNLSSLYDQIHSTILNYGHISVISMDGSPEVVFSGDYDIPEQYKKASSARLMKDADNKTASLMSLMKSVIANDPEIDVVQGLQLAQRELSSLEGYDSREIVMLATGLSTTGVLNFQNNLISADPDLIVGLLEEKEEIPDFSGMTVSFQHLADFDDSIRATSAQKHKLPALYERYVEQGGGTFRYSSAAPVPVDPSAVYPPVTPVHFPEDDPIRFEPEQLSDFAEPVILSEEQVKFIGDSSQYKDPEKALSVLKPIADHLNQKGLTILLCGTTAGDEQTSETLRLSQERAAAVKTSLVEEFGANPDQILTAGLGATDEWHIYGLGCGPAGAPNRKVLIMDASTDTAQEILRGENQ